MTRHLVNEAGYWAFWVGLLGGAWIVRRALRKARHAKPVPPPVAKACTWGTPTPDTLRLHPELKQYEKRLDRIARKHPTAQKETH